MEDKRYEDKAPPGEPSAGEDVCDCCCGTGRIDGARWESCGGTGRVVRGIGGG